MRLGRIDKQGFTLIELSIVLIIIGLIIGSILVGRDLISASETRAQISQIGKYNSAVNAFRNKFGALPGDLPQTVATQFGFASRGQYAGEGDGNGVIQGVMADTANQNASSYFGAGETLMFWADLSVAGMIDGSFTAGSSNVVLITAVTNTSTPSLNSFFPSARIGHNNYVYVWSGGYLADSFQGGDGTNYFGVSAVSSINDAYSGGVGSGKWTVVSGVPYESGGPGFPVQQAYNIDKKMDDGLPQSGAVTAQYENVGEGWAQAAGGVQRGVPWTTATQQNSYSCFDNGNTNGAIQNS
jgi:prepilin-type N-terminal cleavage/methylation domain-containing protein